MVAQHYRWDFIGLSTDTKPTPATSEKVVDGSTFYCSDTSKLYVFYKDTWYEKVVSGGSSYTAGTGIDITGNAISVDTDTIQEKLTAGTGIDITDNTISATGGSGPTVVQTIGSSTTDVMSQDATTKLVYYGGDTNKRKIGIGSDVIVNGGNGIAIGGSAVINPGAGQCVCFAGGTINSTDGNGVFNIGLNTSGWTTYGHNGTAYRLLTGVHDGQGAHDAVNVGQINALIDAINTAGNFNIPHIGA